jgi:hypothetical protein
MKKKSWWISLLFCFFLFLSLSEVVSQEFNVAEAGNNRVFVSVDNTLYGIKSDTGEIFLEYSDEAVIYGLLSTDWNGDGSDDAVIYSASIVMPRIKVLDGVTGRILSSFYHSEKFYTGNSLVEVDDFKLINSKIILASGQLLYKIDGNQIKRIGFFDSQISLLDEDGGNILVVVQKGDRIEKSWLDFNGKVIRKQMSGADSILKNYGLRTIQDGNCDSEFLSADRTGNLLIADITTMPGKFYCSGEYVYYLNDSNFLLKRNLFSKADTSLWNIPCSSPNVFGENVVCENNIFLKNGKEIGLPAPGNKLVTYYDGVKELSIRNIWPFDYRYGELKGNFNYGELKGSTIEDISHGFDYDGDGNMEILLSFKDSGQLTSALLFFELSSGDKKLITLKMTEQQFQNKKNTIRDEIDEKTDSSKELEDDIADKQEELLNQSLSSEERDAINSEVSELSEELDATNQELIQLQNKFANLREIEYINGFDVCEQGLFLATENNVYLFKPRADAEAEDLEFYNAPRYVACVDDLNSNGKKDLAVFSYSQIFSVERDGTLIETTDLSNESIRMFSGAVQIRINSKVYLPLHDETQTKTKIKIFDLELDETQEQSISMGFGGADKVKNGKMLSCSFDGATLYLSLIGDEIINLEQSIDTSFGFSDLCDKISVEDCDDDNEEEIFLLFKEKNKLNVNCLDLGKNVNFPSSTETTGNFNQMASFAYPVSGRVSGDYIITGLSSENSEYMPYSNGFSEPSFPSEVYNSAGEKIFVSLKSISLENGKFFDFGGRELQNQKKMIKDYQVDKSSISLAFLEPGAKVIFVDGEFYDLVNTENMLLQLTSGQHVIQVYQYDSDYSMEQIRADTSAPQAFSLVSAIIFIIIISFVILIMARKRGY